MMSKIFKKLMVIGIHRSSITNLVKIVTLLIQFDSKINFVFT